MWSYSDDEARGAVRCLPAGCVGICEPIQLELQSGYYAKVYILYKDFGHFVIMCYKMP